MIPRILVPKDIRPVSKDEVRKNGHRFETYMDDRTVVPSGMSDAPPLDGKTTIPSHLPLGVLVDRTLVPRSMPAKPIESFQPLSEYAPIAILDSRVVVPAYVEPAEPEEIQKFVDRVPSTSAARREVVQPDIFTTGDANLLIEPGEKTDAKADLFTRVASVFVHIGLIIFLISIPKLFPTHIPTREEVELASRQLGVTYISPDEIPKSLEPPPGPKMRINPKVLNKVAPPRPEEHAPVEAPPVAPPHPTAELPSAPTPHVPADSIPVRPSPTPAPSRILPANPPPNPTPGKLNLSLPNASPGKAIQDQMADAIRRGGGGVVYGSPDGAGRGSGGGGGQGMQGMKGGVSILTPTEGVNFDSYINRLLATVKRNWYYVMPESALMGDKGVVIITFRIKRDGNVPIPDPNLERTSGKEPLDQAAMSSIRTSSPFEPLPPQFKGPEIQLRFIFFYNIPPDMAQ
ncbi:MAG: TonB C-terminal domain-containing protein [Candidatus Acidiferrales bacterium]